MDVKLKRKDFVLERRKNFFVDFATRRVVQVEQIIKEYICGESIIDGSMVKLVDGKIYTARCNDIDIEKIIGLAQASGTQGEKIPVLLQGVGSVMYSLGEGLLFLNADGRLSNQSFINYVLCGYKLENGKVLIFDDKEIIFIN